MERSFVFRPFPLESRVGVVGDVGGVSVSNVSASSRGLFVRGSFRSMMHFYSTSDSSLSCFFVMEPGFEDPFGEEGGVRSLTSIST